MGIKAGLVGLPNVGKSTLFNALTKSSAPMENYPFCTIDPHSAITQVPDNRLQILKTFYNSQKIIPATVTFVDIAGLVKGAATGEGLGNQFLSNIREVDLILHILRCFEDPGIVRTNAINPLEDFEIIVAELILKDLESIEKRIPKVEKTFKGKLNSAEIKAYTEELELLKKLKITLDTGNTEKAHSLLAHATTTTIPLLSTKNYIIIANIAESELEHNKYNNNPHYQTLVKQFNTAQIVPISARVEYELSQLAAEDTQEFMNIFGITEPGLNLIINKTYENLGLITFFTCGPKEIHAWPIPRGMTIRQAAGEIHSDLERGFICAEIFNYNDLIAAGSESALKKTGKIRIEGQGYIVQDGDIVHIRHST